MLLGLLQRPGEDRRGSEPTVLLLRPQAMSELIMCVYSLPKGRGGQRDFLATLPIPLKCSSMYRMDEENTSMLRWIRPHAKMPQVLSPIPFGGALRKYFS